MDNHTEEVFKELIIEYKNKFNTTTMYGISIEELNKEQLMACVCWMGEEMNRIRSSFDKERKMLKLFWNH
ncbi:MAG: hypothetical protein WC055_01030 [Melioribacteraceae bacterium]